MSIQLVVPFFFLLILCINVAGEKGVPGVCNSRCTNSVYLGICSQITVSLGDEAHENTDDTDRRSAYSFKPALLNKLRVGVLTVDQLSVIEAKSILQSFCIPANVGGTETCKEIKLS